jgi:four helix bundle protein
MDDTNKATKRTIHTASPKKGYFEQPIYVESYTLLKDLYICFHGLPRDWKFTLGNRMVNSMTNVVMATAHAFKSADDKLLHIEEAQRQLTETQVCLRMLKDVGGISTKFFLYTVPMTANIAAQLTSWSRYVKRKV